MSDTVKYADKRAEGIALLRAWARQEAKLRSVSAAHQGLLSAADALLQEFRTEFDVPGVRYWEHPESGSFFAIAPGEPLGRVALGCVELERHEFLSRQGIHFGYEEGRL